MFHIYDMLIRGMNLFPYTLCICLLESKINSFLYTIRYADMLIIQWNKFISFYHIDDILNKCINLFLNTI